MEWNHVILECFCVRKMSIEKDKYLYEVIDNDTFKTKRVNNPHYDPKYKTPKKPKFCTNRVCQECYFNDCPHLAISEPNEKDYNKIMQYINKMYKSKKVHCI